MGVRRVKTLLRSVLHELGLYPKVLHQVPFFKHKINVGNFRFDDYKTYKQEMKKEETMRAFYVIVS